VRLTITHEEFEPDSPMRRGISKGWPTILSSFKTPRETGKPLPMTSQREGWHERLCVEVVKRCS